MKTPPTFRLFGAGVLMLAAILWFYSSRVPDTRPPSLDISPLLKPAPGPAAIDQVRAQRLNKSPDLLAKARAARAKATNEGPASVTPAATGKQILAGLKAKADQGKGGAVLRGGTRGTGRKMIDRQQQQAVDRLLAQLGPSTRLQMDSPSGTLRHLRGDLSPLVADNPSYAAARANGDFSGMAMAAVSPLEAVMRIQNPAAEFVVGKTELDDLGMVHVRLDQQHQGIPIYGAQVLVHFDAQLNPVEIAGTYAATPTRLGPPRFAVSDRAAVEAAQAAVGANGAGLGVPRVRRVLYWNPNVDPVAAYVVDLTLSAAETWELIVRADDGRVLRKTPRIFRAAAVGQSADLLGEMRQVHCWQRDSDYLAIDTSLPMYDTRSQPPVYTNLTGAICVFDVEDADVDEALKEGISYSKTTNPNQWDATTVSVMSHFTAIFDYYQGTHNRTSFDGKGINITGLIHCRFKDNQGQLYKDNAFFNPNLNLMVFGDGEQATEPGMLPAALDIVAHELTHGVVDNSAAFRYENQSGALHEHMADFFGCMVDRDDWLMGEDAMGNLSQVAWRDLSDPHNPKLEETSPKTMAEYQNLPNTPEGDLGGVHVNSTIPSYATFLFTEGTNGMGRNKAERIVYRALTQYMTQYAGFVDYRRALLSAANDLYPGGAEAGLISQAFDVVEILEGEAAPAPSPVPATKGEERVAFLRAEFDPFFDESLGYGLYVMDAQQYDLVSMSLVSPVRPAVSGDGTWALFVDVFNDVYWTDGIEEEALTDSGDVRTIAMSKDQRYVAFTSTDFDNLIYILDTQDESIRTAEIQVPTSGDPVTASFADVLSFNCLGDTLYFDAWTEGTLGQAEYGCWGLFSLRIKDLQCQLRLPLSPGLQVGNPFLAHTLPGYLVADYVYTTNGQPTVGVVSMDLSQNQLSVLMSGLNVLAAPTLRGDDRTLVFESYQEALYYLNEATLAADGASLVQGSTRALLWSASELAYPVGFRSGSYTPPSGQLEVNPASLNFGSTSTGTAVSRTLELYNAGDADLELIDISIEGTGADSFRLGAAVEKRLASDQRRLIELAYAPSTAGTHVAALRLKSTAPGQADTTVELAGTAEAGPAHDYWYDVWKDFEDLYPYFEYKQINWSATYEAHRQAFQNLTPTQFGQKLNEVLQILHDWHVTVRLPDGTYIGYQGNYPRNCASTLYTGYTGGSEYTNVRNAGALYHARLLNNFAHIIVDTLETERFVQITDGDIDQIFAEYANTSGMVIDIRNNSGGNEANAERFASRFTQTPRTYGYQRTRVPGSKPYAFEPFSEKVLQPSTAGFYRKPVVALIGQRCMSSAEWFTLMMKVCPNAILIGDRTRGASGNPDTRTLPDLGIEYAISRWIAYDEQQQPYEDRGLAPAITIDPERSFDDAAQRDYVLEKAIAYLEWRQQYGDQLPFVCATSDCDQDGQTDVAEFAAGSDPTRGAEAFGFDMQGIRIRTGGGIELRWKSSIGQKYHLYRAPSITGPFTRLASDLAATPPVNSYADTLAAGVRSYFYLLELAP